MAMTSVPAFPALSDRANGTYNSKAFAWASHMGNVFVPEANALVADLSSLAAGGAYAIPYILASTWEDMGGVNGGKIAFLNNGATLSIDTKSAAGVSVAALLNSFGQSSSAIKGHIRVQKQGDPSKWAIYGILSYTADASGFYGTGALSFVGGSNGTSFPLSAGDGVLLSFQRTGDKGDTGVMGVLPRAKFREQRASGTSAGIAVNGTNTRDLNTTEFNSVPGASLAASSVTLPAGTYDFQGWATRYSSGSGGGGHKAYLHNVTDNATVSFGSSGNIGTLGINDRSLVSGRFTIAAAKTFQLRHYIEATSGSGQSLGFASSSGFAEVYSEIEFLKVA